MSMEYCEMMNDISKFSYLEEYIYSTILFNTIPEQTSLGLGLATIQPTVVWHTIDPYKIQGI
jgi:hypothetical protein